jgi:hypothetical protein
MARPLSEDIRERVAAAVAQGQARRGGGPVWGRGVLGCVMIAALSGDRLGCAGQDGRNVKRSSGRFQNSKIDKTHQEARRPGAAG